MARFRGARRLLLLPALAIGLAGCFKSETAIIDKAHAAYPFQNMKIKTEDGNASLKRSGDFYVYRAEDREVDVSDSYEPILFHEVKENLYVVQHTGDDGEINYLFAKVDGDKIIVHNDCHQLSADMLTSLNIQNTEDRTEILFSCNMKDLDTLVRLAQLPALWSGQAAELQILSRE